MARIRNIKPGLFKNEDLAECSVAARVCLLGLLTLVDQKGCIEDRPAHIRAELFPHDTLDVERLLVELERWRFIRRYAAASQRFIQVCDDKGVW